MQNFNLKLKFTVLQKYKIFILEKILSYFKNRKTRLMIYIIIFYILRYLLIKVVKKKI